MKKKPNRSRKYKVCLGCAIKKPVSEFAPAPRGENRKYDGYSKYCKECMKWYEEHEISYYTETNNQKDEFCHAAF